MHTYFPISESNTQFFYSFNYSMVHFVNLDIQWGTEYDLSTEQMDWLKQDLVRAQLLPFRVVSFHCPIRDSGVFGDNTLLQTQLKPIMQQYNVSLILNGHDHHYERVFDDGLNYVVQGGGGDMQDPFVVTTNQTTKIVFGPTYTKITATQSNLTVQAYTLYGALVDNLVISAGGN
jgi:acid phosphatase